MIFVTVGTQLAFDRMVLAVDAWAAAHPELEFFAQIGPSEQPPRHMPHRDFVPPSQADQLMRKALLVVSHAGMGSVLTALRYRKPILIVPRKASLREHRNEHQLATARWLARRPGIEIAWEADDIGALLDRRQSFAAADALPEHATGPLVERLRDYIQGPP